MSVADRELRAEVYVDAPPDRVWAAITDLKRLPRWSPELVAMTPLKPGGLRVGQWYLGVNRRKGIVWPTRSLLAVLEEEREIAWDTRSSGARWVFELRREGAGTRLVQRRPVPRRLTAASRWFAAVALGGTASHADELEAGMRSTLRRIKADLETSQRR